MSETPPKAYEFYEPSEASWPERNPNRFWAWLLWVVAAVMAVVNVVSLNGLSISEAGDWPVSWFMVAFVIGLGCYANLRGLIKGEGSSLNRGDS